MKRIIEYFARHKLVVTTLTLFIFILGIISVMGLKQDLFPDASMDAVSISTVYPGASAKDVELNVVIPIERKLQEISGVDNFTSISMEGKANIFVEIDEDVKDTQTVKDEIYRAMTSVSGLTDEAEDLSIIDMNPKMKAIYDIGVYIAPIPIAEQEFKQSILARISDQTEKDLVRDHFAYDQKSKTYSLSTRINQSLKNQIRTIIQATGYTLQETGEKELYAYVDQLEKQLLKLPGVSDIRLQGYRDREIKINVIPEKMKQNYLSLNDVVNSISKRNIRVPGGSLQSDSEELSLVTIGQFIDPMEIKDVIIRSNYDQKRITVNDIAEVEDSFKKENIQIRINQEKGVVLSVVKKSEADIIQTIDQVKKFLDHNEELVPRGLKLTCINDDSLTISSLLDIVKVNALLGFIMVFILLLVFLMDLRVSFWTAFGIPMTLLITFTLMQVFDISINMISLGALGMILGIIVDDSIVISESIFKYRSRGYSAVESAWLGVKDVAAPVLVSIFTTIVAFIPLFTLKGMMGKFIFVLPAVVIIALLASLLEALVFLPAHLSHSDHQKKKTQVKKSFAPRWFVLIEKGYQKLLSLVLKFRYLVILFFVGLFIFTLFFSRTTVKNFVLMDDDSSDKIVLKLEAIKGSNLETTAGYVKELENIIKDELDPAEYISIKSTIGHHNDSDRAEEGYHKNWALVNIVLVPTSQRERDAARIVAALHQKLSVQRLPFFESITIKEELLSPDPGKPVNVKLSASQSETLHQAAGDLKEYLAGIDGIINIEDNGDQYRKEWNVGFDYDKMAKLGIAAETAAQVIRTAFEGTVATSIQTSQQDLDFRVMIQTDHSQEAQVKDEQYLLNLLIPNSSGQLIRLGDFARLNLVETEFSINHEDGDIVRSITADLVSEDLTAMQIKRQIEADIVPQLMIDYPVQVSFGGEAIESQESLLELGIAFLLAILMIYFILILLFNDLTEPLLIMLTIPFGIIGALLAFVLHGMPLSFMGIVGIIGLSGVVINDCVVMVDFINKELKKDRQQDLKNAIINGAKERLRPVILTTLTTVCGLLPTAYGIGGDSPLITPIAIAIAYGLLFATLLTLIFIPSIFYIRLDFIQLFAKIRLAGKKAKPGKIKLVKDEV